MINDCINEIKQAAKQNPNELFSMLVKSRLQLALKSYYADLSNKFNTLENQALDNSAKVFKKLI